MIERSATGIFALAFEAEHHRVAVADVFQVQRRTACPLTPAATRASAEDQFLRGTFG
jgi:hypothetical protein